MNTSLTGKWRNDNGALVFEIDAEEKQANIIKRAEDFEERLPNIFFKNIVKKAEGIYSAETFLYKNYNREMVYAECIIAILIGGDRFLSSEKDIFDYKNYKVFYRVE